MHCPSAEHASGLVHASLSSHPAPLGLLVAAGQAPLRPEQTGAVVHCDEAAPHGVPALTNASGGQVPCAVHVSATSHAPLAARHSVPAGLRASPGHALPLPGHVSTRSHASTAARHTALVLVTNASLGQAGETPSH